MNFETTGLSAEFAEEILKDSLAFAEERNARAEILYPLINTGKQWLVAYVITLGADPLLAGEIAQESIFKYLELALTEHRCKSLETCRKYVDQRWTRSWLYKAARHALIDHRRSFGPARQGIGEVEEPISDAPGLQQLAEAVAIRARYTEAVRSLPPVQRAAWITLRDTILTSEEQSSLIAGISIPGRDLSPDAVKAEKKLGALLSDLDPWREQRLAVRLLEMRALYEEFYRGIAGALAPPTSQDEYRALINRRKVAREAGEETVRERKAANERRREAIQQERTAIEDRKKAREEKAAEKAAAKEKRRAEREADKKKRQQEKTKQRREVEKRKKARKEKAAKKKRQAEREVAKKKRQKQQKAKERGRTGKLKKSRPTSAGKKQRQPKTKGIKKSS